MYRFGTQRFYNRQKKVNVFLSIHNKVKVVLEFFVLHTYDGL